MTYQLFGPNPICDALQVWLADFRARNHPLFSNSVEYRPPRREKADVQLSQYIPQFRDQKLFLPPRTIALMRQAAKLELSEGRDEVAYQRFKRICEITADIPDDWKQLLNLAQKIHRQVVPMLCELILTRINDPLFRFQTESLIETLKKEKVSNNVDLSTAANVSILDGIQNNGQPVEPVYTFASQSTLVPNDTDLIPKVTAVYSSQPSIFIDTLRRMAMKMCDAKNYLNAAQLFKQICEMTKHTPSDWDCLIYVVKKFNPAVADIIGEEKKKHCRIYV